MKKYLLVVFVALYVFSVINLANAEDYIPTLDKINETSQSIILSKPTYTLKTTKSDGDVTVIINGTTYYYTPKEGDNTVDLQNLAKTGNTALVNGTSDDYFYTDGINYYKYDSSKLPKSGYILTEVSDATSTSIKISVYDKDTNTIIDKYYELSLNNVSYGTGENSKVFNITIPNNKQVEITAEYGETHGRVTTDQSGGDITGDFVDLKLSLTDESGYGAAIYNQEGLYIGDITGNFIENSISATGTDTNALGGAIYNAGFINSIKGNFLGNYAIGNTAQGSAIYNETTGVINNIEGDFIGNYVITDKGFGGGTITNYGTINNISGHFIGNYVNATTFAAQGAAIYNRGTIYNITADFIGNESKNHNAGVMKNDGTIYYLTGDFIGNKSKDGRYGGALENGVYIGLLSGNFIGNTAMQGGALHTGGSSVIDILEANFKNNWISGSITFGGAINMDGGTINIITGDFIGNYIANGQYAAGGAIANNGGIINVIKSKFINNHAAVGGAISNESEIKSIESIFIGNYVSAGGARGGAISNGGSYHYKGTIENITSDFINNYAMGSNAKGGAIYNNDIIENITSNFTNNYAMGSNAKGGAIYTTKDLTFVADNQTNTFSGNYVQIGDGEKDYQAIYMDNATGKLTFDLKNRGQIIFNDNIDGQVGYKVDIKGDNTGSSFKLTHENSAIKNADVTLSNATLKLSDASKNALSTSNLEVLNNSVLDLSDDNNTDFVVNTLKIALDENLNIDFDWGDTINSTNPSDVQGQINLHNLDMTGATVGSSYNLTTTSSLMNGFSISQLIVKNATQATGNVVAYDFTTGILASESYNLKEAIEKTENQFIAYGMLEDEPAGGGIVKSDMIISSEGKTLINDSSNDGGIQVGKDSSDSVELTVVDTNASDIVLTKEKEGVFTVTPNSKLNIVAENNDVKISGTTTSGLATSKNAIYLKGTTDGTSQATIVANNDKTVTINDDVRSDYIDNTILFQGGKIITNGVLDPLTAVNEANNLIRNNYDDNVQWQLNGGKVKYDKDAYLYDSSKHGSEYTMNSIEFNGGSLDLQNGLASSIVLADLKVNSTAKLYLDVDLAKEKMDTLSSTNVNVSEGAKFNIAGLKLLSDSEKKETIINFTEDEKLKSNTEYTGEKKTAYSAIYKYDTTYDKETGNFTFLREGGDTPKKLNPAILASPIAAQTGGYLNQLNSYENAFTNMDMYMLMTKEERQAMKLRNKYAAAGVGADLVTYDPTLRQEEQRGIFFRPYASFEKVNLQGGPRVENNIYGTFLGGDSDLIELGHGWDMVYSAYASYDGSHQNYDDVSIYQNGGHLGSTTIFYKDNFFTGLTANVGASVAETSTMFGNENFTLLMAGIANKTGYNWELFKGRFIIQPSMLLSYSFVHTFDYTNAAGVDMHSSPLNAIQIAPQIKFIGNLPNGWQPYANIQSVWNIMDDTKFKAANVNLPQLSVEPYVQYGVGLQKKYGDRFTGFFQTMIRNGGRTGVALSAGFRWTLGKGE